MKKRTKIIYLDIDGTLRDPQRGIPESAVWSIRQCRKQGIRIVICTGRSPGAIQDDVLALPKDGVISGGGCYIRYHGQEIQRRCFQEEMVKKVFSLAPALGLSLALEAEQEIFMDYRASVFYREDFQHRLDRSCVKEGSDGRCWRENKIFYQDNIREWDKNPRDIHKICIFGKRPAVEEAEENLEKEGEIIQKRKWHDRWYLELLPKGCDKGSAIDCLNRRLGIPRRCSMSFGDGENDIGMLKATGIAVAMGNGDFRLRKYASSLCESAGEDGIYKELVRRSIIIPQRREENERKMVAGRGCLSDLSQKLL